MADLTEVQAAGITKLIGSDATGLETNTVNADSLGSLQVASIDRSGSGNLTALDTVVTANTQGMGTVNFNVTGTWVGTVRAEGTLDGGTTWLLLVSVGGGQAVFATSTVNDIFKVACAGYSQVRMRMSAYTSGTAVINWDAGIGVGPTQIWNTNAVSLKTESYGLKANATTVPLALTPNSELKVVDGLRNGGVYGVLTLTTGGTQYEAKVGGSRLTSRKSLTITANNAGIFWGYDNAVTTTTGTPIANGQTISFSIDPDSTFQVWLVGSTNGKTANITESP